MKKILGVVTVAAVSTVASIAFAGMNAGTGVNGSYHDMNTQSPGTVKTDKYQRVCVFCHTPHNAAASDPTAPTPLWNRDMSTQSATSFQGYNWAVQENVDAIGGGFAAITDPLQGPTRLCLSCHDGTVALDSHNSNNAMLASDGLKKLSGARAIGSAATGQLSTTHPVGFSYNKALTRNIAANGSIAARNEIAVKTDRFATSIAVSETPGVPTQITRNGLKTIGQVLYNGDIFTCASCHEVHNKDNAQQDLAVQSVAANGTVTYETYRPNYFLYAKETSSAICLSCHIK